MAMSQTNSSAGSSLKNEAEEDEEESDDAAAAENERADDEEQKKKRTAESPSAPLDQTSSVQQDEQQSKVESWSSAVQIIPTRTLKTSLKPAPQNALQFVKIAPCPLYHSAQQQISKCNDLASKKKKTTPSHTPPAQSNKTDDHFADDWQSNLDSWKWNRRKQQEHIIERVVEVKKLELEEQVRQNPSSRKVKTFQEIMQQRSCKSRKPSIYHEDDDEDTFADLGLSSSSTSSSSSALGQKQAGEMERTNLDDKNKNDEQSECSQSVVTESAWSQCSKSEEKADEREEYKKDVTNKMKKWENRTRRRSSGGKIEEKLQELEKMKTKSNSSDKGAPVVLPKGAVVQRKQLFEMKTARPSKEEKPALPTTRVKLEDRVRMLQQISSPDDSNESDLFNKKKSCHAKTMEERLLQQERFISEDDESNERHHSQEAHLCIEKMNNVRMIETNAVFKTWMECSSTTVNLDNATRNTATDVFVGSHTHHRSLDSLDEERNGKMQAEKDLLERTRSLEWFTEMNSNGGMESESRKSGVSSSGSVILSDREEDSGIQTADVSSSVSQADDFDMLDQLKPISSSSPSPCSPERFTYVESPRTQYTDDTLSPPHSINDTRTNLSTTSSHAFFVYPQQVQHSDQQLLPSDSLPRSDIISYESSQHQCAPTPLTNQQHIERIPAADLDSIQSSQHQLPSQLLLQPAIVVSSQSLSQHSDKQQLKEGDRMVEYEVMSLEPSRVLEPPKEKPPPPPAAEDISGDESSSDDAADSSISSSSASRNITFVRQTYQRQQQQQLSGEGNRADEEPTLRSRMNSTKRIKKQMRDKRSSFLGIETSSVQQDADDAHLLRHLETKRPPDMNDFLEEERRFERQLYDHYMQSEHQPIYENTKELGIAADAEKWSWHQQWNSSRSEEPNNEEHTSTEEDDVTLYNVPQSRSHHHILGENLVLRLQELQVKEAQQEKQMTRVNRDNNDRKEHTTSTNTDFRQNSNNCTPISNIQKTGSAAMPNADFERRIRTCAENSTTIRTRNHSFDDFAQTAQSAPIEQHQYQSSNNYRHHLQPNENFQNLMTAQSMPNIAGILRSPPAPIVRSRPLTIPNQSINSQRRKHSEDDEQKSKRRQSLQALSAVPKSRIVATNSWMAASTTQSSHPHAAPISRRIQNSNDTYNYQHWLIQEAEHRRITERQQMLKQQPRIASKTTSSQLIGADEREEATKCKGLPDSVIETLTQRLVQRQSNLNGTQQPQPSPPSAPPPNHNPLGHNHYSRLTCPLQASHSNRPLETMTKKRDEIGLISEWKPPDAQQILDLEVDVKPKSKSELEPREYLEKEEADNVRLSISGKRRCSHCSLELGRGAAMIIESLCLCYHVWCFKCWVCAAQLGDGSAGADVRVRNSRLHCHHCYSNDTGVKYSCV